MQKRRLALVTALNAAGMAALASLATAADTPHLLTVDPLTGVQASKPASWTGRRRHPSDVPILVLAGHADSQGIEGAGTSGAAVDRRGAPPMDPRMRDELFWNRHVRDAVVAEGQARGLNISSYEPERLSIPNPEDPDTNWSVGRRHHDNGGYALEIHFDAYGKHGVGSGLIPNLRSPATRIDESLALNFGRYPLRFRGGLGAPKRGISILEIGKLEGALEAKLRDPISRDAVITALAHRIIEAIQLGVDAPKPQPAISSQPDEDGNALPTMGHQTSAVDG